MIAPSRPLPWWTWVLPGLIAHLGTEISRFTAIAPGVSAMYLPIPFGIAMICWWGPRILPAFYLNAVLSAGLWGLTDPKLFPIYALPETLAVLSGWWMFRLGRGRCSLPQLSDVLKFVALVALPAALCNSLILSSVLVQFGDLPADAFWTAAWAGGVGTMLDSMAIAVPFLVLLTPTLEAVGWSGTSGAKTVPVSLHGGSRRMLLAEVAAVFGAVLTFSLAVALESFWSVYLLFALWAAIRHGMLMALLANVWIALLAVLLPAVMQGTTAFPGTTLFNLQAALVLVCFTGLVVGRAIGDQQESRRQSDESDRALAESEAFLRLSQRAGRAGSWEWDLRSDRFKWSEELAAIHGIALDEFDGQPATLIGFCHPDDRSRLIDVMRQVRQGVDITSIECRMIPRTGGEVQMRWTGQILRDDDGTPVRVLGVATDVSDRKYAEAALVQSEERLRLIIREQTDYIVKWLPDGTRTFVNDAYCRAFGVTEAECLGTSFFPHVVPEYREMLREKVRTLTPEQPEATTEHLSIIANGEERWQQWTERGLFNAQGQLVELLSTGRDVTERRRAEDTLREVASRYKAILESSLDGVIVIDANSAVLEFNAAAEELFGYRREDAIGRPITELIIPPELHAAHNGGVARYLTSGVDRIFGQRLEMPAMRADGSQVRVELAVNVIAGTSPPLFAGVVRDISPRLKLEEQLRQSQKMEAVGRLAGGVAHDFNNLLTIITGYATLLEYELPARDSRREMVDGIQQAARQSASLTRQLLAFSRRQVIALKPLDLTVVVADVCKILGRLIGEDVVLCTELHPGLRPVMADAGQIEQVLLNLAVNARDAMDRGGQLTITTANAVSSSGEPQVVLTVSDTGRGMTPEVQQQIFEPFFTTKGAGQGTGLGLSVVHGIVSQLGGQIVVESSPGAGATFRVYLPLATTEVVQDAAPETPLQRGSGTVLVVEDEPTVRALTVRILREVGYLVHDASSGEEALVIASDGTRFDLLVTDVVMPGISGRELVEQFAVLQPHARILYVSGYTDDAVIRHGVEHQQVNFLQKPFTPGALTEKVREVMG